MDKVSFPYLDRKASKEINGKLGISSERLKRQRHKWTNRITEAEILEYFGLCGFETRKLSTTS